MIYGDLNKCYVSDFAWIFVVNPFTVKSCNNRNKGIITSFATHAVIDSMPISLSNDYTALHFHNIEKTSKKYLEFKNNNNNQVLLLFRLAIKISLHNHVRAGNSILNQSEIMLQSSYLNI